MNKVMNKISVTVIAILLLFGFMFTAFHANAETSKAKTRATLNDLTSVTVSDLNYTYLKDHTNTDTRYVDYLIDNNSNPVFCIDAHLSSSQGDPYVADGKTDGGVDWLLYNHFVLKDELSGDRLMDYYITQMAIRSHLGQATGVWDLNGLVDPYNIVPKIQSLAARAQTERAPSALADSNIGIVADGQSYTIDGDYYVSPTYTIGKFGQNTIGEITFTSNGPSGTIIENVAPGKVRVKVPMESVTKDLDITLSAKATANTVATYGTKYASLNPARQSIATYVSAYPEEKVINVTSGSARLQKRLSGSVLIEKADRNGNPLPNAEFTLTDQTNKKVVMKTDITGKVSFPIVAGNVYSIEETKNPSGYYGTFKENGIQLSSDGEVIVFKVVNDVEIIKASDSTNLVGMQMTFVISSIGLLYILKKRLA